MSALDKFILAHKLSCARWRGGIAVCNCGRDKAAAELARQRAIEAAARPVVADVYRMMQLIGGDMDERKHVEELAAALKKAGEK